MSIWDCEKPLDAMMLSHDHIAMLAVKHEQQIKDIAAHLLELKRLVTPMMEFKREKPTTMGMEYAANFESAEKLLEKKEWVDLTVNEKLYSNSRYAGKCAEAWHGGVEWAEIKLKEKNGG